MAEVSRNLRQLRGLDISVPLRAALDNARPEILESGAKVGIASMLVALLEGTRTQESASMLVHLIFEEEHQARLLEAANLGTAHDPDAEVAEELIAAFDDALQVRSRTGGRYTGTRHFLFALFTGQSKPVSTARHQLLARVGVKEAHAAEVIASYCLNNPEEKGKLTDWLQLLKERGIPAPHFPVRAKIPAAGTRPQKKAQPTRTAKGKSAASDTPAQRKPETADHPSPEAEDSGSRLSQTLERAADALREPSLGGGDAPPPDEADGLERLGGETPGAPPEPEPDPDRRPEVPMLQADDPWSASVEDQSGARSEAEAFAAMVTATEFEPPLAVGIFGDWGSGKSFFMRLLHDAVDERARQADEDLKAGIAAAEGVRFYSKVVQIRFNAWHYAETNLWASLVDHVFVCLDKWAEKRRQGSQADRLFDRLATARRLTVEAAEQLVSLRREHAEATVKRDEAAKALDKRRDALESSTGAWIRAAWNRAVAEIGGYDAARAAARRLGLTPLAGEAADTADSLRDLEAELAQMPVRRRIALPIAAAGMALALAAAAAVAFWLQQRAEPLWPIVTGAVSALTAVAVPVLVWARIVARRSVAALRDFREALNLQLAKELAGEAEEKAQAQRQLQTAEAAATEAEERLRRAACDAAEAAHDYHANTGKGRALDFVRARLAKGDYAKHLGFIATVRRDFEELSARMKPVPPAETAEARELHEAHVERLIEAAGEDGGLLDPAEIEKLRGTLAEPEGEDPVFERIILYIDDLDRCQPHQVVKVLQAIHLLLTFPLFVVFVAVDVRWLRHALARQYAGQVTGAEGGAGATASASDYLEKIFQIPYWVRPIDVDGTRAILNSRMGEPEAEEEESRTRDDAGEGGDEPDLPPDETADDGEADAPAQDREEGGAPPSPPAPAPPPLAPPPPPPPPRPGALSLRLTGDERNFIQAAAALLDGSPRRTLRFLNTYRIIKGSLPPREAFRLERGGYRALLTMLSIAVSIDDCYPALLEALAAGSGSPVNILRHAFDQEEYGALEDRNRVQRALNLFDRHRGDEDDLAFYARLAARYSFNPEVRLLVAAPLDESLPEPPL